MQKILAEISTKDRYDVLHLAMLSVAIQTRKPDKLIIFDDTPEPKDLRDIPIYTHIFNLLDEHNIAWEVRYGQRKGQHFNHETANTMHYDLVWRIDDDEFAEENVLEVLESKMKDDVGAVGGCVLVPNKATEDVPDGTDNSLANFFSHPNIQWFRFNGDREVEHLTSTFLYRANVAHYNLALSMVAHTEETQFTNEIHKAGYKIIATGDCKTWHFRQPNGGIRSGSYEGMWKHDEDIFKKWLAIKGKLVVLDNGVGDHFMFRLILPEMKKKYKDITIACCYPNVFGNDDVHIISIEDAEEVTDLNQYNAYKYAIDHKWNRSFADIFRKLYL